MFSRRFALVAVLMVALFLSGCSIFRKKVKPVADDQPLRLGRVALVNEEDRFALIETFLVGTPAEGTTLRIYNGTAVSAELKSTAVRRRPFLVADLVAGMPAKGDIVFQPHGESKTPPRAEPAGQPGVAATSQPVARKPAWRRWLFPFGK